MAYIEHSYDPEELRRELLRQQAAMGPMPAPPPTPAMNGAPPPLPPMPRAYEPPSASEPTVPLGEEDFFEEEPPPIAERDPALHAPSRETEAPPPEIEDPRGSFGYKLSAIGDVANNLVSARDRLWNVRHPGTVQAAPRREVGRQYLDSYYQAQQQREGAEDRQNQRARQKGEDAYVARQREYKEARLDPNSEVSQRQAKILESMPGVSPGTFFGKMSAEEMDAYGGDYVGLIRGAQEKTAALDAQARERAGKVQYLQSASQGTVADRKGGGVAPFPEGLRKQIEGLSADSADAEIDAVSKEVRDWQTGKRGEQAYERTRASGPMGVPGPLPAGGGPAGPQRRRVSDVYSMSVDDRASYLDQLEQERLAIPADQRGAGVAVGRVTDEIKRARDINEREVPGLVQTPAVNRQGATEVRVAAAAAQNIDRLVGEAKKITPKNMFHAIGRGAAGNIPGSESAQLNRDLEQRAMSIYLELKNLHALGVLAGPDMQVLDAASGNPAQLRAAIFGDTGKSLDILRDDVRNKFAFKARNVGYQVPDDVGQLFKSPGKGPSGAPRQQAAAPAARGEERQLPQYGDDIDDEGRHTNAFDIATGPGGLGVTTQTRPRDIPKVNEAAGASPLQLRDGPPPPAAPAGKVRVRLPDGRTGSIDADKVEAAIKRGAVRL